MRKTAEDFIPLACGQFMTSECKTLEDVMDESKQVWEPFERCSRDEICENIEILADDFAIVYNSALPNGLLSAMNQLAAVFFDKNGMQPLSMDDFLHEYRQHADLSESEKAFAEAYIQLWDAVEALEQNHPATYLKKSS